MEPKFEDYKAFLVIEDMKLMCSRYRNFGVIETSANKVLGFSNPREDHILIFKYNRGIRV